MRMTKALAILWTVAGLTGAACLAEQPDSSAQSAQEPATATPAPATVVLATDPGPRGGPASAGGPFAALDSTEKGVFSQAQAVFEEVDSVSGTIESGVGLGPAFNGNSCAMCHAQPTVGGSSPGLKSPQNPIANPQVALATLHGAKNTVPSFITTSGPVREARFITITGAANGMLDGGVHDLFTIAGRSDAPGCTLAQPNFAAEIADSNVIFRVPTPVFGLGLVEATPDETLQANLAANASEKTTLGIAGRFNTSGNDGTITRFGWKAQNKSVLIFAAEAYNVEQGVSNEGFTNERSAVSGCVFNPSPEDHTNFTNGSSTTGTASQMSSDIVNFGMFIRLLAPPTPAPQTSSITAGQTVFGNIGCALCHSPSLTTGSSIFTGMSHFTFHPYSDFALHHMGGGLADGVNQGVAVADEFRTAPLWGLGQRLFFMHDGRTSDLVQAILAHDNIGNTADIVNVQTSESFTANGVKFDPSSNTSTFQSEAHGVVANFSALNLTDQTNLLAFLRSL
jgi:CxxC motif-containing protein (DUF1111 family)